MSAADWDWQIIDRAYTIACQDERPEDEVLAELQILAARWPGEVEYGVRLAAQDAADEYAETAGRLLRLRCQIRGLAIAPGAGEPGGWLDLPGHAERVADLLGGLPPYPATWWSGEDPDDELADLLAEHGTDQ
jgi:hypothetical protein